MSGIATACRFKAVLAFDQFRLVDRQAGVGGTWWINRYPGVACDVPAAFYSFSWALNPEWRQLFPPGAEIAEYLEGVCRKWGVWEKCVFGCEVKRVVWVEEGRYWECELWHLVEGVGDLSWKDRERLERVKGEGAVVVRKEVVRAGVVVSAVGALVEPRGWPAGVSGREQFEGRVFHSARWEEDVEFEGKDVVVVGTGCSAAQFVPKLVQEMGARRVTQVMRSPPWVVPRAEPPGGEEWWEEWAPWLMTYVPGLNRAFRAFVSTNMEYGFRLFKNGEWNKKERRKVEQKLLEHMKKTVPEKYHEILTPDYGVGCKRRIFDAHWFPALQDPRLELTTQPLTAVHKNSVTLGPGRIYPKNSEKEEPERTIPADIIVVANGFDITKWLHPLTVIGRDGQDLVEEMERRGGPQAYQGTAMDGFPNFFIVFGPSTATGHSSVILASENMVNYALKFIKLILNGDAETVEVKKEAEEDYTRDIQRNLKDTIWSSGGCNSWCFDNQTGWNSTMYP